MFSEPTVGAVSLPRSATGAKKGESTLTQDAEKGAIAHAKAKYSYPWWASENPLEVFWGQVNEEIQIVSSEQYHTCAQEAMGRVVFKTELNDAQALIDEFLARVPQVTAEALLAKIPRRKQIVPA